MRTPGRAAPRRILAFLLVALFVAAGCSSSTTDDATTPSWPNAEKKVATFARRNVR